ncbi:MAG: xylan 1,4-beta-xylosidase [Christensenellaceae bacterium]|nr:xylan 1,4-beta-xylosidase [Christensenellaceae bacterium]
MKKYERFEKVYPQGKLDYVEILVDKQTGVNYIFRQSGYAGGMTVLLDKDGKPVITPVSGEKE